MPKWLQAIINFFKSMPKTPAQPSAPVKPAQPSQPSSGKLKNTKWYSWILQFLGKTEFDKEFDKFLSGFWKIVGLNGYKTIVGSKYAWCGLIVAAALYSTGYQWAKNGAGAKNWSVFGTKIDFKTKGIPHTAIVRLNHGFDCSSSKGNHVGFACGNYKPSDFFKDGKLKAGATITLLGGNQGHTVKYSDYDMREICSVTYPSEEEVPEVTETIPCDKAGGKDSTTR